MQPPLYRLDLSPSLESAIVSTAVHEFNKPFRPGFSDCCIACCNVWRECLLIDPAAGFRERYRSLRQARIRFGTVEQIAELTFGNIGWQEIDPATSQTGDAGLTPSGALAIRFPYSWGAKMREGWTEYEPHQAVRAWGVML